MRSQKSEAGSQKKRRGNAARWGRHLWLLAPGFWLLSLSGCAPSSAVASGYSTALDATDLVAMTDECRERSWQTGTCRRRSSARAVARVVQRGRTETAEFARGTAETVTARVRSCSAGTRRTDSWG